MPARPRDRYLERKLAGLCTYCGTRTAADGSQLCDAHLVSEKKRRARAMARLRKERRRAGKCYRCGRPAGGQQPCAACRIAAGRPAVALPRGVSRARANRVTASVTAARTAIQARTWRDAGGRSRYHGQDSRGRQSNAQLDDQDLTSAINALNKAKEALEMCNSPEIQALPKIQREAAKRAALSQADHGARFIEEVLDRNRYAEDLAAAAPRGRR